MQISPTFVMTDDQVAEMAAGGILAASAEVSCGAERVSRFAPHCVGRRFQFQNLLLRLLGVRWV